MKFEIPAEKPRKPTQKQMDFILLIEETLDVPFEGETLEEASSFIDEHVVEFQREQELNNSYGFDPDEVGYYSFSYEGGFDDGE